MECHGQCHDDPLTLLLLCTTAIGFLLGALMTASMLRTTTAVTIIEGGVKANVLPIRARAVVNHRILPGETRHFQAWTRDVLCGPPPMPCPSPCGAGGSGRVAVGVDHR